MTQGKIQVISHEDARSFIETWHYSHKVPTGRNIFFGWYKDNELYAVADYGDGVNHFQAGYLSKVTGHRVEHLIELRRLCRIEPRDEKYPLTSFISKCHKRLRTMGYEWVVSFSDPMHNHTGGIYKAANFRHMGKTVKELHAIDQEGNLHHRLYYYRYAERNKITLKEAREQLGLTLKRLPSKDRWLIYIGYDKSIHIV